MKKIITLLVFFIGLGSFAQVGIGNTNPDPSSILDLTSTTQGMLAPRMTESDRDAITSPANGLLIYQTNNASGFYYWDGSSWKSFGGGGTDNDWTINGSDMYNANPGNVGVGNTNPTTKFHVEGVTTLPVIGSTGTPVTNEILNDDFEDSTLSPFTNKVGNDDDWIISTTTTSTADGTTFSPEGIFSARTVTGLGSNGRSRLLYTPTISASATSATVEFKVYTSTEGTCDCDKLFFYIDNNPVSTSWRGNTAWTTVSFPLTIGQPNILEWEYAKDNSLDGLQDIVAIDNVKITETIPGTPIGGTPGSYVFRLDDGQQALGKVLTSDADGNATWQSVGAGSNQTLSILGNDLTISGGNTVTLPSGGGGGSYTFTNGLTESGGTVRLGGTLTNNTGFNLSSYDISFDGTDREVMEINSDDNFVGFGGYANPDADDGSTFIDSGSRSFVMDFVSGFHSSDESGSYSPGTAGGSAVGLGSIEYIVDGLAEVFINNDFNPLTNGGADLGSASKRWGTVYASNGTINTSDINLKTNIKKLDYGLSEIMKLETITYNWKDSKTDNAKAKAKISQKETKIGFIAQNLLEVLPETVNTHSMVAKDEKGNYERVKNKYLGVYYSDIIPVAVKAIQEQQEIIEVQNNKIESLEAEILKIESLKSQISNLEEMVNKLISSEK